jgi:ABC-2 type transport system permease protein
MIDLLATDVHRIRWRPLAHALVFIAIMVIAFVGVVVFVHSGKHPFNRLTALRGALVGASAPLALGGFILGASLVGADYASRALTTLLIWEPRRGRVLTSRALACAAVTALAALGVMAVLLLALLPAAIARGTGPAPTLSWYVSLAALAVRCALLAATASAVGMSFATVGRSTAAALGIAAVYIFLIEQAVTNVAPSLARWLVVVDAISWIASTAHGRVGGLGGPTRGHTVVTAGLLLLAVVVALHAAATVVLKHRDIA